MSHEGSSKVNPEVNPEKAAADLRVKVDAAKEAKEKSIARNLKDRESLILGLKENKVSLDEAKTALKYFDKIQKTVGFPDSEDAQKFEEIKELVRSLEAHGAETEKKVDEISGNPEILNRLQDEANAEELSRESKKTKELLYSKMEKFGRDVEDFSERNASVLREIEKLAETTRGIVMTFGHSRMAEIRKGGELKSYWDPIWFVEDDRKELIKKAEEFKDSLFAIRESLGGLSGMFKGKEKTEIDLALEKAGEYIKAIKKQGELADPLYVEKDILIDKHDEVERDFKSSGQFVADRYGLDTKGRDEQVNRLKNWIKDSVKE